MPKPKDIQIFNRFTLCGFIEPAAKQLSELYSLVIQEMNIDKETYQLSEDRVRKYLLSEDVFYDKFLTIKECREMTWVLLDIILKHGILFEKYPAKIFRLLATMRAELLTILIFL